MAAFLNFEWERCVDGYDVVQIDPRHVKTDLSNENHSHAIHGDFLGLEPEAPDWLKSYVDSFDRGSIVLSLMREKWVQEQGFPNGHGRCYLHPRSDKYETYRPLEENPSLYLELANLPLEIGAAANFISRYGPLGGRWNYSSSKLETILSPHALINIFMFTRSCRKIIGDWKKQRPSKAPRDVLNSINQYLDDLAGVKFSLRWSDSDDRPHLSIKPNDLEAALWIQLAQSIAADHSYKSCEVCQSWFEITPGRGRPDKKYCSNACSMRAYRKRNK